MIAPRGFGSIAAIATSVVVAACSGGGGGGASSAPSTPPEPKSAMLELLAGMADPGGNVDGVTTAARFSMVAGLAVDASGNVFIADDDLNNSVRKMDAAGNVTTLVAGFTHGLSIITASPDGTVYVNDGGLIRRVARDGTVSQLADLHQAGAAGIAADGAGNIFVASNSVIRKVAADGTVTIFAGKENEPGDVDGPATTARFQAPRVLVIDGGGNLYVSEGEFPFPGHAIRKITPSGVVSTFAGRPGVGGSADGAASQATFGDIVAMAIDATGAVFVLENQLPGTSTLDIRKIAPDGIVATYATSLPATVYSLAVDRMGRVLAGESDSLLSVARGANDTALVAGGPDTPSVDVDGRGAAARFSFFGPMATGSDGTSYVANTIAHTFRKVTADGVVTTMTPSSAITGVTDIAVDPGGNVIVEKTTCLEIGAQCSVQLYRMSPTGQVTSIPVARSSDGTDLTLPGAWKMYVDAAGSIYIGGAGLYRISPDGDVTTVSRTGAQAAAVDSHGTLYWLQYPGTVWRMTANGPQIFSTPMGANTFIAGKIAFDSRDNLYFASGAIWKVSLDGTVSTVVGTPGVAGFRPGPLPASLDRVAGMTVVGNTMYIGMPNGIAVVRTLP